MKRKVFIALGIVVIVGLMAEIGPTINDEIEWRFALHEDETISYLLYLKAFPKGRHAIEANSLYDVRGWEDALAVNTISSYRDYVERHHQGRFIPEAKTKISALQVDQAPFMAALQTGNEDSLKKFLTDFPGHEKEAEVQQALTEITEGRNIVDLLKEKKIEIKTQGSGIKSVNVSVRRLVPYSLTVSIPVGTYFVSANASSQNMVTTAKSRISLDNDDWQDVSPNAACANRPRDIPGSDDRFTVQRSPHQAELAKLMPFLDKESVSYAVRQAAVWIVTDNADYDDLGILVSRSQFQIFDGTRQINEYEAAQAIRICDQAGINIKKKSIWRDRQMILGGLEDGELKKWLADKK